ncbi:phage holin family protein [Devosia nitrariae]|uniref:Superfamily III holin-X n=1 Tax=Devosia nitrariae TaxID=2071872 RepID=A0ABQ5W7F4_9HYPH|nr:phage holin family protein [Devosia nitrariae]GLQ55807.1 hypothetical protein GCM10010862_30660 [Devosia nitrariae]
MDKAANPHSGESLPELVRGLIDDVSTLFRKEVALAKAEAGEKVSGALDGAKLIVIGAVLAIGALGVLLAAIVAVVAAGLTAMGLEPFLANSLAALIVAVVVGLIAWALINNGLGHVRQANFNMQKTARALSDDAAAIKERV